MQENSFTSDTKYSETQRVMGTKEGFKIHSSRSGPSAKDPC